MAELLPLVTSKIFSFFWFSTNFILPAYLFLSLEYEALQKRVHSLWKNFLQGGRGRGGRELIIMVNR